MQKSNSTSSNNNQSNPSPQQLKQNREAFMEIIQSTFPKGSVGPASTSDTFPDTMYQFMHTSDFWTAPASTRYHDSHEGGLVKHSLKVYEHLMHLNYQYLLDIPAHSLAKCALFHDFCKVNFYRRANKNVRMEDGTWTRMQIYEVQDEFPVGHGEKSVIMLLEHGMKLTAEEMLAIRHHMGGWDPLARDYIGAQTISNAMGKYPLVTALHIADMMASWL